MNRGKQTKQYDLGAGGKERRGWMRRRARSSVSCLPTPSPPSLSPSLPLTPRSFLPPYHCGSAVLCCGRLKWPLWAELNISVHSGRASQCLLPPAASAPGTGCQPACRPTSLNPCQAPDATLGGPASCGSGRAQLESPPPTSPPLWLLSAAANNLTMFPMWSSTENQSMLQVIFLS